MPNVIAKMTAILLLESSDNGFELVSVVVVVFSEVMQATLTWVGVLSFPHEEMACIINI